MEKKHNIHIKNQIDYLKKLNKTHIPYLNNQSYTGNLQKVLVANRGDIAKKVFESLYEESIPTVAIVTDIDINQSWYDMAGEVVLVGHYTNYSNIHTVLAACILSNANAIFPGYGFLSESYEFVKLIEDYSKKSKTHITFMGPSSSVIQLLGDKVRARNTAKEANVPVFEGSDKVHKMKDIKQEAKRIGYPVVIKLSAGGGGRGITPVYKPRELLDAVKSCQRLGASLYNDDSIYIEKYIKNNAHIEVQIFNGVAISTRKCAIQRNYQKFLEENGSFFLNKRLLLSLYSMSENIAKVSGYDRGVGTVEFLFNVDTEEFGFLEINPRLQVEYAVTEQALDIDLIKWLILYFDGRDNEIDYDYLLKNRILNPYHSIQCRIYAEDPENNYFPSPGRIQFLRLPSLKNVRFDFGFFAEDSIVPQYDNLIGKVIAYDKTRSGAIKRLSKALNDIHIKGLHTTLNLLSNIITHKDFVNGSYNNSFLEENKDIIKSCLNDDEKKQMIAFGALSHHFNLLQKKFTNGFYESTIENFMNFVQLNDFADIYKLTFYNQIQIYTICFIQIALDKYVIFIDNNLFGIVLIYQNIENDDSYILKFKEHRYKVSLDTKDDRSMIKVKNNLGVSKYARVTIHSQATKNLENPGEKKAPFQSSFVKLFDIKTEDYIKKGTPIITISAMKMETTLKAHCSGNISYLIENGNLSKLQIGKTPDGLIIGRSIQEGEVLFCIEEDSKVTNEKNLSKANLTSQQINYQTIMEQILEKEDIVSKSEYPILSLIRVYFFGFISTSYLGKKQVEFTDFIVNQLKCISIDTLDIHRQKELETNIYSILNFYYLIKTIYSNTVGSEISNFDAISIFYLKLKEQNLSLDLPIQDILNEIFELYASNTKENIYWLNKTKKETIGNLQSILWYVSKALYICLDSKDFILHLITILLQCKKLSPITKSLLNKILKLEEEALDSSIYLFLQNHLIPNKKSLNAIVKPKKWPVEKWAELTFDAKSYKEVLIKSIDTNSDRPIGSKIYIGTINNVEACFYMKDSRISGGATGNLEGLKYIAACFIAYFKGIPLYVWNDGAGANIKEGVIALKRAGEGFLLNSIIGARLSLKEFSNYIMNLPDDSIQDLFNEVFELYAYNNARDRNCFIVSVGIGSSTGLDVYGSSQTGIQVMLDSEVSYRVLTGAFVIKSVTGEEFTNYEIGGGQVMYNSTGIVDLLADNKKSIINYIKNIQHIFASPQDFKSIQRKPNEYKLTGEASSKKSTIAKVLLINNEIIQRNVDNQFFLRFKEGYYEANHIIGGFARLGGRSVLISSSQTHFGIRSLSGLIKAKELLEIAYKTGSHQLIIFGAKTYNRTINENHIVMKARQDLVKSLSIKNKLKIYIITHVNAIYHITINSFADIIIFVKNETTNKTIEGLIKKTTTFIVNSIAEAFDLSHKLISMIDPVSEVKFQYDKKLKPRLPVEYAQPFDIINNIILKITDTNSFIEFYKDMNDKNQGPSLIVGIATINGKVIGILADQPMILGGAADAFGTDKFTSFVNFSDKNNIPILMLSNSPGFLPGKKQEYLRIQQIGAHSLNTNILSKVPVVAVILNQNFGGRLIHAFNKYLRPGIVNLAFSKSIMGVMGAQASFDLFLGKKYKLLIDEGKTQEAIELKNTYQESFNEKSYAKNDAFNTGNIDWLIKDKTYLREHLSVALDIAVLRINRFLNIHSNENDLEYIALFERVLKLHKIVLVNVNVTDKTHYKEEDHFIIKIKSTCADSKKQYEVSLSEIKCFILGEKSKLINKFKDIFV